ncbi:MAG: hypothetical protein C0490_05580 [Marivirga sp.]|nr:hypothetical protein [Marivirga sp.]
MNILRNILAVILGYATFVVSAVLLFQLSEIDPHADPSVGVIILTIVFGIVFSFIGGLLTQLVSKTQQLTINYVLAGLMAGFAAFSLFKSTGNHYSQIAAIFLFAPTSIFGGLIYLKKRKQGQAN